MPNASQFHIYQDARSEWRWELRAKNGVVIAKSPEGYASQQDCLNGLDGVKSNAAEAEVVELT